MVFSLLSLVVSQAYIGFLGVLPIAIGLSGIAGLRQADESEDDPAADSSRSRSHGNILAVATVTIANGGDIRLQPVLQPLAATQHRRAWTCSVAREHRRSSTTRWPRLGLRVAS